MDRSELTQTAFELGGAVEAFPRIMPLDGSAPSVPPSKVKIPTLSQKTEEDGATQIGDLVLTQGVISNTTPAP